MRVTGYFTVTRWHEDDVSANNNSAWLGQQVSRIDATFESLGEVTGTLTCVYLMQYANTLSADKHDSSAIYTGYLLFNGSLVDIPGSFMMRDDGAYKDKAPRSELTIINGTGSGMLLGVTGGGNYHEDDGRMVIELDIALNEQPGLSQPYSAAIRKEC